MRGEFIAEQFAEAWGGGNGRCSGNSGFAQKEENQTRTLSLGLITLQKDVAGL